MRFHSTYRIIFVILASTVFLFSCNEKEDFASEALKDYMPLLAGKYIT